MDYKLSGGWATLLVVAVLWELIWKGLALWRAARNGQAGWYVVMLLVNSLGVLPIVYLLLHKGEKDEVR